MKALTILAVGVSTFLSTPSGAVAQTATMPETAVWHIDPVHSELTFRIRHFVTKVRGTFSKFSGSIVADPKNLGTGSSVGVTVDVTSIDTNNERRDGHLRSPDFFAADSFPQMTFKSTKIEVNGKAIKVTGDLTIRGKTKPIVLTGEYGGVTIGMDKKARIGFEATGKINRMDYGVSWNSMVEGAAMLGDDVEINITVEAIRQG